MAGSFFSGFSYTEEHLLDMILQLCLCDLVMCILGYLGHVPRLREQWTCRIDTAFLILHILELVVPEKGRSKGGTETERGGQERSSKTMLKRTPASSLGTEENGGWYSRRLLYSLALLLEDLVLAALWSLPTFFKKRVDCCTLFLLPKGKPAASGIWQLSSQNFCFAWVNGIYMLYFSSSNKVCRWDSSGVLLQCISKQFQISMYKIDMMQKGQEKFLCSNVTAYTGLHGIPS